MTADLTERLRAVVWEPSDDAGRMPDDPALECVHVDMRPAKFAALLIEAADALEAAREDAARLNWLEDETSPGIRLHSGDFRSDEHIGLGIANTGRTLRQAIDSAREARNG